MGEAVADEAELALLDILLDGVEELLLGDLERRVSTVSIAKAVWCGVVKFEVINRRKRNDIEHTSSLPLVHLGISTTMFRMVCCSLA